MSTIQQFDYSVGIMKALLWQYNDAESLKTLLTLKQQWYDDNQSDFWNSWYTNVFNLVTANDFGLSVWSIILDLPLYVGVEPDPEGKNLFGFGTLTNSFKNFGRGNFTKTGALRLSTEEKRALLRLKYFKLTSRGSVPDVNAFMLKCFGSLGTGYIQDIYGMRMRFVFNFVPSKNFRKALELYDVIPRPATVGIVYELSTRKFFGFGPFNKNFGHGGFYSPY